MGYVLHAALARTGVMVLEGEALEASRVVGLTQSFEMIPVTKELLDLWGGEWVLAQTFEWLNIGLLERLEHWSKVGRVAYLEIETWAGVDDQRAAGVWERTEVIFAPGKQENVTRVTNTALSWLGVQKVHHQDEFDALELGLKRQTERWLEEK